MKSSEPKSHPVAAHSNAGAKASSPKEDGGVFGREKQEDTFFGESHRQVSPFFAGSDQLIQPKLDIHPADDIYEKEADRAADQVVQSLYSPSMAPQTPGQTGSSTAGPALQMQRAFNGPTLLEQNSAHGPAREDTVLQRKAGSEPSGGGDLQQQLQASDGSGRALPDGTRSRMESGFGADFGKVKIHDDDNAASMNRQLGARAFAHGSDIYFNRGEYNPGTPSGDHLLAHELTHTLQQSAARSAPPAVQQKTAGTTPIPAIYQFVNEPAPPGTDKIDTPQKSERNTEAGSGSAPAANIPPENGNIGTSRLGNVPHGHIQKSGPAPSAANKSTIDFDSFIISIDKLELPKLKERNNDLVSANAVRPRGYVRKDSYEDTDESSKTPQKELWETDVRSAVNGQVNTMTANAQAHNAFDAALNVYYLSWGKLKLIGSKETITNNALVPLWNKNGGASAYDVDHIKELQLGGTNSIGNMELVNFSANRSSGATIKNSIERHINDFLASDDAKTQAAAAGQTLPGVEQVKKKYDIKFLSMTYKGNVRGDSDFWTLKDIKEEFNHLKHFEPMKAKDIAAAQGKKGDEIVYTSEAGGRGLHKSEFEGLPGVKSAKFTFPNTATGDVAGNVQLSVKPPDVVNGNIDIPIPVYKMEGVIFGGSMPRRGGKKGQGGLEKILSSLQIEGLSPATVDTADIVPGTGLVVRGRIHPTLDIVKGIDLDFFIEGDNFGISKTITAEDIKVPAPFKINAALLTIGAGTRGIFVEGQVLFEISKLGTGMISGKGSSNGNFGISGKFDFDKKLFKDNKASIGVEYDNVNGWAISGNLEIGKDKVKGVESGSISVTYANSVLAAAGTAKLKVKGVEEVGLSIKFGEGVSEIEGRIKIAKLPGIKGGSGTLKMVDNGGQYDFSGSGSITPDIPGIDSNLSFEFKNDLFLVDAHVAFDKSRLKGTLNVGITNRAVNAEGVPTGEALPDMKVFGSSDLELKITDSIMATAGVKLLENGEIEVKGGIKLPQKLEVVPVLYKVAQKPIISIPAIHIPLFGIPLGVATIGIEAVIEPRLVADVQIGPGSLTNVAAEITYNPSHPDDMTITGGADFEFIAEAGITAGVDFGISASIAIASLTGGISLSAFIKAAVKQPVFHADIKYSPATGFELNGNVQALVDAVLGFEGNLFAKAKIGVWPLDYTKRWEWPIFKKEINTGLQIGFEFPFNYKNGKADVSFDNLQFKYPSMDDITTKVKEQIVNPIADQF